MNSRKKIVTIQELTEVLEKKIDTDLKIQINILLEAMNDYPISMDNTSDFVKILREEVGEELNSRNITNFIENLKIKEEAWKIESLTSVLNFLNYGKLNSQNLQNKIDEILEKIK